MDEELLNAMYSETEMESQGVSKDDFQNLLSTSEELRSATYSEMGFKSQNVSYEDFEGLIGVKKKVQEEVQEEPQEMVQEDTESVSEDGSLESQDWRGEQQKSVAPVVTSDEETFKTLEQEGQLEKPKEKKTLEGFGTPLTEEEKIEESDQYFAKRKEESEQDQDFYGYVKSISNSVLGDDFDYLSKTTEEISDMFPADADDNSVFQLIEERKNNLLNKQGKDYYNKMLSDSSQAYLDRGDAATIEEARDFTARDYSKSMRSKGINSLGLDSDRIDEAKPKIDEYYKLRQIPYNERTPEQRSKIYELKDYVSQFREDSEKFFINPETGKIDGEKKKLVNDLEAKYSKEAKTDFQKFSSRYKQEYDNLNAIDNSMVDAFFGDRSEVDFNGEFGLFGNVSRDDISRMTKDGTLPDGAVNGRMTDANVIKMAELGLLPEGSEKVYSLLEEKEKSELNFSALSRALLLNENPSAVAKGWGEFFNAEDSEFNIPFLDKIGEGITSFGESFAEAIPGVGNVGTDRDFKKDIVRIANEEGVTLTEKQYDSAVDNMAEKIGSTFGTSAEIMGEIIVTSMIARNASSAINLTSKIGRLVSALGGSQKTARIAGEGLKALEQAVAFDLTSQGSAAMGMGEFLGAKGADKVLNLLSKGKSAKFMKFIKPLTRVMGATTAGTVEEYGGEYLEQGFKNGFISKETFRNTFGRDYDEAKDKLLMTLILTGTFGTGAEVSNMYNLGKDYYKNSGDQTQLNDVEKAYTEIQKTKQEQVLTKFDNMSDTELEKYAEENDVDISELKKTIEAAKKPEAKRFDDMSQKELEAYAEENDVDISELKKEETTEVEPGDITAKPEEVVEEGDTFTEEIKELAKEDNKEVLGYIEARSAEEVSEVLDNNDLLSKVKNDESINESQAEEYTNKIYDLIDSENVVEGSVKESELYDVIEKIENYDNKTKTVKKTTPKTRLLTRFRENAGKVNEKAFRDQVSGSEAEIGGSKGVLDVKGDQVFITEKGTRRSLGKAADILTQDITTDNILKDENGTVSGVRINTPSGEMIINNPEVGLDMGIQLQEKIIGRNPLSDIEVAYENVIEEEGIEVAVEKPKPKKEVEPTRDELTDEEWRKLRDIEDKEVKRFFEDKGTKEMTSDAFLEKAKKDPNTSETDLKFLEFALKLYKGKIKYNKEFEYKDPFGSEPAGMYDYETGDIMIFNEEDLTTWFVTHEAIHGITQTRLEEFGKFKEDFDLDFSKEITRLFEYAKKNLNQDEHYGLTNIHEFVAEAFGNPDFRAELGKIRDTKGAKSNVFSSFVKAIKNLFKSQNIDIEASVLESIIKATEKSASTTLAFDGTKKTTTTKKVEKDLEGSFTKEEMTSKMDKTSLEKALEKVNALDNKLRNLSLSDPFLITPAAKLLLAAVRKGLKVGISLEQAISKAKKEIIKSKEYKVLRKEDQKFIDDSSLDDIVSRVEQETKGEQQKREDTLEDELNLELEALIEESLDTKKPKTDRDVRKIQKRFKDFISANKKILRQASPALNATIANKLAGVSSPATLKSTAEYISKIIKDTKFKKEQEARAKVIDDIRKEIDIKSFRKKGGKYAQGTIAIELDKFFQKIRDAVNLTKEEVSEKIDSILKGVKDFNDISIEDQETLMTLDFADLDSKSIESLNELKKTIKEYKSKGRQWLKLKKEARAKKYKEGVSDLKTAILGKDVEMNPNLRKGSTKTTVQEIKASFTKLIDTLRLGVPKIENWAGLLNHINNLSGKQVGGNQKARDFLKEKFLVPVQKARSQKTKNVQNITNNIKDKKQSIFGKNISKVNKDLQKTMFVRDANGNRISSGEFGYLSITKDQAMYIYNLQKDPTLADTFNKMKKDPANKALTDTANKLVAEDSKLQEYADWVHNDFYPNYYNRINAEYRKQYDFNLPFNENYSPIRRIDAPNQDVDMLNPTRNIASTLNGSLKERITNTKDLDLTLGMDGTMLGYMDSMEHFITHTDAVKFLNRTFNDSGVKNVITQKLGSGVNGVLDRFIKSLAGNQKADEATMDFMDKLRRRYTTAVLGLNPVVFIKQMTSAPAYATAEGVNTLDYVNQAARMLTTKEGIRDLIDISRSDYVRDRLKRAGFDRDTALNYKNDFNKLVRGGGRVRNKLMFLTKYGDIGAIIIGGTPYYTSMKKKYMKQGMSRAEATEKAMFDFENATEATQQSSSASELSDLQRGSKIMKLFTMFKTSPAQYLRKGMTTPVRNIVRGRGTSQDIKNIAMFNVVLPTLFTAAGKGLLLPDEDDAKDYVASVTAGNLSGIPVLGDMLTAGVSLLKGEDFGINSAPVFDAIFKLTKAVVDGIGEGEIPMDELIEDIAIPAVELRTGLPVKNAKKLTIDNLERINKGNFDNKTLRKFLGYSDYSLGIEKSKKEKTRLEKREEQRGRRIKNREKRRDTRNR